LQERGAGAGGDLCRNAAQGRENVLGGCVVALLAILVFGMAEECYHGIRFFDEAVDRAMKCVNRTCVSLCLLVPYTLFCAIIISHLAREMQGKRLEKGNRDIFDE